MTATDGAIAVATSIPPGLARKNAGRAIDDDYQRHCIQSWIDCGFRVLSVNDREEIPPLAARYPQVEFVATDRNASVWTGRKNPYIADLLQALVAAPEAVVGIINSDLLFEASPVWRERLPALVGDAVLIGQRYDTTSLWKGMFRRYYPGFDFFFFDRATAAALFKDAMPFAMGLPWWDYWLPVAAAFLNRRVLVVDRPGTAHLIHRQAYVDDAWRSFARFLARFAMQQMAPKEMPSFLSAILPACREIDAWPEDSVLGNPKIDPVISQIVLTFYPHMRENTVQLDAETAGSAPSPLDESVATVFRRFEQRFAAGEALEQAKALEREGRLAEAEPHFLAAFKETPEDFDVLLAFGEYAFRRGEAQRASQMLREAATQQPESARALTSLAMVLRAMDRREEAIDCLKNVLRNEPKIQDGYIKLAVVLSEACRYAEALDCLERALAQWPAFSAAAELHRRISQRAASQA